MSKTKKLSFNFLRSNLLAKVISSFLLITFITVCANAQRAIISKVSVGYPTAAQAGKYYCDDATLTVDRSFWKGDNSVVGGVTQAPIPPVNSDDPTINSSLIEFDQPYNWGTAIAPSYRYPNHCLQLCVTIQCTSNKNQTSPSPSFPIDSVRFEVFKFLEQGNPLNENSTPPLRTIQLFPSGGTSSVYRCGGYKNEQDAGNTDPKTLCDTPVGTPPALQAACPNGTQGTIDDSLNVLNFCTAWDGSYNFDSEFAKTNGTFGLRANIKTQYQPDPIVSETPIEIDMTTAFPAANQQPIMIDVTDVHSLRASPTVVGLIDSVTAQPYIIKYRLSKDSKVTMKIFDASKGTAEINFNSATDMRRRLLDNESKKGEGNPDSGQTSDNSKPAFIESAVWDGRDDAKRLLPAGNYLLHAVAETTDEWARDLSREKTYQISLDPLQITDLVETGLDKNSIATANLSYFLTEAATVYFQVYSPGTTFTTPYTPTTGLGVAPGIANASGVLVYNSVEQKASRTTVSTKWDGRCNQVAGCVFGGTTYTNGQYLPDGDYVYVIWAEIPYTTRYVNSALTAFDAVKTVLYRSSILPVNRGQVNVEISPIEYSKLGSSPVAYGLDPFVFKYTLSRDSSVNVYIKNTQGIIVKTLLNNQEQMANQVNQFTWNGIDDYGRYVSPGTYMFEVTTKDPLFGAIYTQAATFPVDIFRIVDVADTPLLGETSSQATISYTLAKTMNVAVYIYDKSVTLPNTNVANWPPVNFDTGAFTDASGTHTPIKSYRGIRPGEGLLNLETWDGTRQDSSAYLPDGQYPYIIVGRATAPADFFNDNALEAFTAFDPAVAVDHTVTTGGGFGTLYATDRITGFINIARGPVYFLDNTLGYSATSPKLLNSTQAVNGLPVYTITFAPSRTAQVDIDILSRDGKDCYGNVLNQGVAQPVCRTLKNVASNPNGLQNVFPGSTVSRVTWDGKDDRGAYVAAGYYTVRVRGNGYPINVNTPSYISNTTTLCTEDGANNTSRCTAAQIADQTGLCPDRTNGTLAGVAPARSITCPSGYEAMETFGLDATNIYKVFDISLMDLTERNSTGLFAYQVSVPMKVALQIFRPGTYIKNNLTGEVSNMGYMLCRQTPGAADTTPACTAAQLANPSAACTDGFIKNDPTYGDTVYCPTSSERDLIVKSVVGMRANSAGIEEYWDGKDYAGQDVPDGIYPFRFVTSTQANGSHIDSFYGDIDNIKYVSDWSAYGNMVGEFVVARGDGKFVCEDWKKTVIFYPNPFRENIGKFEVTKVPVPGEMTLRIYNIAGDLVRTGNYPCVDNNNTVVTMGSSLYMQPDNDIKGSLSLSATGTTRNAAVRCEWDKKNDHGRSVARGVYLGLVDFKATGGGKEHCQKVVKILIP